MYNFLMRRIGKSTLHYFSYPFARQVSVNPERKCRVKFMLFKSMDKNIAQYLSIEIGTFLIFMVVLEKINCTDIFLPMRWIEKVLVPISVDKYSIHAPTTNQSACLSYSHLINLPGIRLYAIMFCTG